jgi:hypothetical protein
MPLATAALADVPVARRLKPNFDRFSRTAYAIPASTASRDRPSSSFGAPGNNGIPDTQLSFGSSSVARLLPVETPTFRSRYAVSEPAIAFSMIVEITSLTPRVTFSTPAREAHTAPTTIATTMETATLTGPGSQP